MKILAWAKGIGIVLLASCLMSGFAFGQGTTVNNELTQGVVNISYHILLFLAWSRSVLAVIAGKLMTNDLVTGGFLHLDLWLWKIRNIMKNFANFGLGFVFLYFVLKSLFDPSDDARASVVNKVKGFILAGVLIQISRFAVVALVDISTVLTSSVGNLPSVFLSDSPEFEKHLMDANANVIKKKRLILDTNDGLGSLRLSQEESTELVSKNDLIDSIMPNGKTLSGPLLFLGLSIFSFQDVTLYDYNTVNNGGAALITILLNAGITIMYAIALLLLIVVNVVRLGFIRILIAAAPVFALLRGLKRGGVIEKDPLGSDMFSAKALIELIFIPVRVVLFLSLIMIFVTSMWRLMTDPDTTAINQQLQNYNTSITNSQTGSVLVIDNIAVQSVEGDIFKDLKSSTQNTLADLIIFVFTLVLMWILVKASYPSDNAITGKITQSFFEKAEQIVSSLPIIPLPGGGKIAPSYVNKAFERLKGDAIYSAFGTKDLGDLDRRGKEKWSEWVGKQLGQEQRNYLNADERKEIEMAANGIGGGEYSDMIQKYASSTSDGFTLQNSDRKTSLHTRLKKKLKGRPLTIVLGNQKFETKGLEFSTNIDEDLKKFFDMTNATRTNSYFFDQFLTKDIGLAKQRNNPVNSYAELSSQFYRAGGGPGNAVNQDTEDKGSDGQ